MIDIDSLKRRLPEYLTAIGVEHTVRNGKIHCRCPLHDDHSPSFTAEERGDVWVWHCFPCGKGGTVLDLHAERTGKVLPGELPTVAGDVAQIVGMAPHEASRPAPLKVKAPAPRAGPTLPADISPGTQADWAKVARLRKVDVAAPAFAASCLGTLQFAKICGFPCWILTDSRGLCAEARRMDGNIFPAVGELGKRKAHTIRGSVKSWPVGLSVRKFESAGFRAYLGCEGGPDYLAALHFALLGSADLLPFAFLGAGAGGAIHPEALSILTGKRIRLFPHADESGKEAVRRWTEQLRRVGAGVDAFDFSGLRQADESPVTDLNDCTSIRPEDAAQLEGMLP